MTNEKPRSLPRERGGVVFQRFVGRRLKDAEERQNKQDNDDHTDDVKDIAHNGFPSI
jgi:hypothetical protein